MYSGSTFHKFSGHLFGAHQKIDRIARRHLEHLLPTCNFPGVKTILHFEGNNGPDGIKRKSPAKDEPWHYLQPFNLEDTQLIELIEFHYEQLVISLQAKDTVRAGFEAAWLAHAIVDGLTPAHHYPYEEKLVELRNGSGIEDRTTIAKKLIMPGQNPSHQIKNNWKMWGPKGLFTTHAAFESGVAAIIAPRALKTAMPKPQHLKEFQNHTVGQWFRDQAQAVAKLELYDAFYESGWTLELARRIEKDLAPSLIRSVTVIWHGAVLEAQAVKVAA
jgi:hypothetical protein